MKITQENGSVMIKFEVGDRVHDDIHDCNGTIVAIDGVDCEVEWDDQPGKKQMAHVLNLTIGERWTSTKEVKKCHYCGLPFKDDEEVERENIVTTNSWGKRGFHGDYVLYHERCARHKLADFVLEDTMKRIRSMGSG